MKRFLLLLLIAMISITGCAKPRVLSLTNADRLARIPDDVIKGTPENDETPPILHSDMFEQPVPLEGISTAGAEDTPFIPIDRDELYFMFVKDVREEPSVQIRDAANGLWRSKWVDDRWADPEFIPLQKADELALNGAPFVSGDLMFFVTARAGFTGLKWFTASDKDGFWTNWKPYDFDPAFDVGELHIHRDELYYHSSRDGGIGGVDIWMIEKVNGEWVNPENITAVNTPENEGMPYISPDGNELWFNRTYNGTPAVFCSKKKDGEWQEAELIVSQFAGEPTLDKFGNLYFVHHYYRGGEMIEADIYIARRK